jgi:hypothetical protein
MSVPVGGVLIAINALGLMFSLPGEKELTKLEKIEENPLY